ncbi:HPr family phosphocarrier protein [Novosphingopyxis sp.]|uniref:HPr family phosphocarrier protein n=1 Tax=Novosphingopyxis sp. TaxID=2709690 RepID=UPI003B5CAEB8
MSETARRTVTIVNDKGLHARASAKFVAMVARLPDDIAVEVLKDGHGVPGGSIMGLMMLGAAKGNDIDIAVTGPDAERIADKLVGLVMDGFGE